MALYSKEGKNVSRLADGRRYTDSIFAGALAKELSTLKESVVRGGRISFRPLQRGIQRKSFDRRKAGGAKKYFGMKHRDRCPSEGVKKKGMRRASGTGERGSRLVPMQAGEKTLTYSGRG